MLLALLFTIPIVHSCSKHTPSYLHTRAEEELIEKGEYFRGQYKNFDAVEQFEHSSSGKHKILVNFAGRKLEYICSIDESTVYSLGFLETDKESLQELNELGISAVGEVKLVLFDGSIQTTSNVAAILTAKTGEWEFATGRVGIANLWLKGIKSEYRKRGLKPEVWSNENL